MPEEILFKDLEELKEKVKPLIERTIECRIKWNKNNAKLKFRTKRKLFTAVLTPENTGSTIETFREKVKKLAEELGCKDIVEIE